MGWALIHLDTNVLILALVPGSPEAAQVEDWLVRGVPLAMTSVAWYEFLCGASVEERRVAEAILRGGIRAQDADTARLAASLFLRAGGSRRLKVDALVAAAALLDDAPLATRNRADFAGFAPFGLRLV